MPNDTNTTTEVSPNAELKAKIQARYNKFVTLQDVKFGFKTVEVKDESTGLTSKTKRGTIEMPVPTLNVEGIIDILENGETRPKELALLLEAVADISYSRAREIINGDENINAQNFPYESLSWEAIANLPKAERRGGGISKEQWEEFGKDYIAVMPGLASKTVEQVTNASKILCNRFAQIKTNKPVIKMLKAQLGIYASNAPAAETFTDVLEFLVQKADALLAADETALLANL